MKNNPFAFKSHGWAGLGLICFVEFCLLIQHRLHFVYKISVWATPLCWVGYVMLLDAVILELASYSDIYGEFAEYEPT